MAGVIDQIEGAASGWKAGDEVLVAPGFPCGLCRACLSGNDPLFLAEVRRLTGKRGVDVVVEHVGAHTFDRSIRSLTRGGRLVTCGATTGAEVTINLRLIFFKTPLHPRLYDG